MPLAFSDHKIRETHSRLILYVKKVQSDIQKFDDARGGQTFRAWSIVDNFFFDLMTWLLRGTIRFRPCFIFLIIWFEKLFVMSLQYQCQYCYRRHSVDQNFWLVVDDFSSFCDGFFMTISNKEEDRCKGQDQDVK